MLVMFIVAVAPGSGLMYALYRLVRSKDLISVARMDAARAGAQAGAAQELAAFAQETTREALATGQTIESVDEKLTELTAYLVRKIEGAEQGGLRRGRHTVRAGGEFPALSAGQGTEGGQR